MRDWRRQRCFPRARRAVRVASTRALLTLPANGRNSQDSARDRSPAGPRTRRLRASVRGQRRVALLLALAFALRLDAERLAGDVERAVLRVLGYAPDVLAHDPQRQHLDAAEEEDRGHQRRP